MATRKRTTPTTRTPTTKRATRVKATRQRTILKVELEKQDFEGELAAYVLIRRDSY